MRDSNSKKRNSTVTNTSQQNIIAIGTKIVGDIESKGAFRIDGDIEGNITTEEKVVIGKSGSITGTLKAVNVDIEGKFSGKLHIKGTLSLKSSAHIDGEVQVNKLAVEPGATFNATCVMGAVKTLAKDAKQKTNKGQIA